MDEIYLRRNCGEKHENMAIFAAIAVNEDRYHELLGVTERMKEDKVSWFTSSDGSAAED